VLLSFSASIRWDHILKEMRIGDENLERKEREKKEERRGKEK